MKVLLVTPSNCDLLNNISLPLGLISIGTYLKHAGHEVKVVDLAASHISIKKVLKEFKPDVCGVSLRSQKQIMSALDISKKVHKLGIPVVWGGSFCNQILPQHLYDTGVIDIISFGEGEKTWVELANALENKTPIEEIKGIAYKKDGKFVRNEDQEFVDLSTILPCDWSLVDVPKYFQHIYGAKKLVYVYLSKGCPGHCGFCYNVYFHNSCQRHKSVEIFMTELKELVEKYGIDGFYLADEFAFSKKSILYELCDALDEAGYQHLKWGFETRIGVLNKEDFERVYKSGCRWTHFGIETVSPRMVEKVKKNIPLDKVVPTINWLNEIGMIPITTFIIGLPGETVEEVKQTVTFIKNLPTNETDVLQYSYLYSSPFGQEIYNSGKYKLPSNIKEYRKLDLYSSRMPNFSEVPRYELKVIQGYFLWKLLFKKDYPEEIKHTGFFYKQIQTVITRISHNKLIYLPEALMKSFFPFVRFFYSAKFCKKTLQKYGLD